MVKENYGCFHVQYCHFYFHLAVYPSWQRKGTQNPSLSASGVRIPPQLSNAMLSEWSKEHAWRACVSRDTGGSNPLHGVFIFYRRVPEWLRERT